MVNHSSYEKQYYDNLSQLRVKFRGVDENYPFELYEQLLSNTTPFISYTHVSKKIDALCRSLANDYSTDALDLYHRCLLLYLIDHAVQGEKLKSYPQQIQDLFAIEYQRIAKEVENNHLGFYNYDNDLFCKDLAVCICKMFPVGALKVEVSGIPRRILFVGGWRQLLNSLKLFFRLGKIKPTYEIHLDIRYRADFTPEGWDNCFLLISEMLGKNPELLGVTGASWFFDPQISMISPHLCYLRKRIEDNGGKFFFFQKNNHTTELALCSSITRRKLYDKGLYKPASYMTFWARTDIMIWARKI